MEVAGAVAGEGPEMVKVFEQEEAEGNLKTVLKARFEDEKSWELNRTDVLLEMKIYFCLPFL